MTQAVGLLPVQYQQALGVLDARALAAPAALLAAGDEGHARVLARAIPTVIVRHVLVEERRAQDPHGPILRRVEPRRTRRAARSMPFGAYQSIVSV